MIIEIGSFAYFLYPLIAVLILAGITLAFRGKSVRTRYTVLLILSTVNIFQHLFKNLLYPHLWGQGFGLNNTAYNNCALIILITPFIVLSKSTGWKDFLTYIGSVGAMAAMLYPYWFFGKVGWGWEALRFYFCHSLMFINSLLPVCLGLHRPSWKSWYKIAPIFLFVLAMVLLNDTVMICLGLAGSGMSADNLYESLCSLNPLWTMCPPETEGNPLFAAMVSFISACTPPFLFSEKICVPLLWYAIPFGVILTILAFLMSILVDRQNFLDDIHHRKKFPKKLFRDMQWKSKN